MEGRPCASLEQSGRASKAEDAGEEAPESPKGVLWEARGYRCNRRDKEMGRARRVRDPQVSLE